MILMAVALVVLAVIVELLVVRLFHKNDELKEKNDVIVREVRRNQQLIDRAVQNGVSRAAMLMTTAILTICSTTMLTSCSNDDNSTVPPESPGPLAQTLEGFWWCDYDAKGSFAHGDGTTDTYEKIVQAYKFSTDGTGEWEQFFMKENGDLVRVHGGILDLPGDDIYNPAGLFQYTTTADGTITIQLQIPQLYEFPTSWQLKYQKDCIIGTDDGINYQLAPGSKQIEQILQYYDQEYLSGGEGEGGNNSKELDADVVNVKYEIIKDTAMWKFDIMSDVLNSLTYSPDVDKELERITNESEKPVKWSTTRSVGDPMITWIPSGFRYVDYTYESVDEQGKPITLSSRVCWGVTMLWGSHYSEFRPNHLVLCPHSTIADNASTPTQGGSIETLMLQGDRVLILPDYIGYGVTKNHVHPYTNHELCAQNCIDALKAGYKVFADLSSKPLHPDWRFYVIGASQGGGNALAIHKWLDEHEDFANRWRFEYSYCAAGPYSPRITFEEYFKQKKLDYPIVLPLALKAMFAAYPDILGKWKEDDFYSEAYLPHKEKIDLMIASKDFPSSSINAEICKIFPHTGETDILPGKQIYINEILAPDVCDLESEKCKALFQCFDHNDLTKGWTPKHPIHLYHSPSDTYVGFANSKAVMGAFPDMATLKETPSSSDGHIATCILWMLSVTFGIW